MWYGHVTHVPMGVRVGRSRQFLCVVLGILGLTEARLSLPLTPHMLRVRLYTTALWAMTQP